MHRFEVAAAIADQRVIGIVRAADRIGADAAVDALRQGAAVAALAVAAAGDTPGLPSAATLAAVLRGDADVAR